MTYYVNDNACATLEDAEEVVLLYRIAGIPADIITEQEYFETNTMAQHMGHNISLHKCKPGSAHYAAYRCVECNVHLGWANKTTKN